MYKLNIKPKLDKKFEKIAKKDPQQFKKILNKVLEISKSNPNHYKNLQSPLQEFKRVHIDKSFVLLFTIKEKTITLEEFEHHDKIYR